MLKIYGIGYQQNWVNRFHRQLKYHQKQERVAPVVPWLSYSLLDPMFAGSNPTGVDGFFFSDRKNPEYDSRRKGSQVVGPVSNRN